MAILRSSCQILDELIAANAVAYNGKVSDRKEKSFIVLIVVIFLF